MIDQSHERLNSPRLSETETGTAMFRIVQQPEEAALLCAIRDRQCPADEAPGSVLLSLMTLRMLKCDEHGKLHQMIQRACGVQC